MTDQLPPPNPRIRLYDFIIVLKRPRFHRMVNRVSQMMIFLFVAVVVIDTTLHRLPAPAEGWIWAAATAATLWWIFCVRQERRGVEPFYRLGLLACCFGWVMYSGFWLACAYLVAIILERPIKVAPEAGFDEKEIVLNTFPKTSFRWDEVSNVVLKDGLLTLDLKSNRLIQREVDAEVTINEETEFNQFCGKQLGR